MPHAIVQRGARQGTWTRRSPNTLLDVAVAEILVLRRQRLCLEAGSHTLLEGGRRSELASFIDRVPAGHGLAQPLTGNSFRHVQLHLSRTA